jgi:hypothetical protein
MFAKVRRVSRPSPAMVVALVGLFVALGGPGYAASAVQSALFAKRADRARYASRAGSAHVAGRAHKAATATSAKKAGKVDGFNASATPIPNTLLALGANGKFPAIALPNAPTTRVTFRRGLSPLVGDGEFAEAHVGCVTGETLVTGGAGFIRGSDGRLDPRPLLSVSAPVADANAKVLEDGVAAVQWQAAGRNQTGESARLTVYAGCAPTNG